VLLAQGLTNKGVLSTQFRLLCAIGHRNALRQEAFLVGMPARSTIRTDVLQESLSQPGGSWIFVAMLAMFSGMADSIEHERMKLRIAALKAIGRAMRQQPELERKHDVPARLRELLAKLEKKGKPKDPNEKS
jgi:hypothetical protein